jgi:hypothetical protein
MKTLCAAALAFAILGPLPRAAAQDAGSKPKETVEAKNPELDLKMGLSKELPLGELKCSGGKRVDKAKPVEYPDDKCGFGRGTLEKEELIGEAVKKEIIAKEAAAGMKPPKKKFAKKLAALHLACDSLKDKIGELKEKPDSDEIKKELQKAKGAYKKFYKKLEDATHKCRELPKDADDSKNVKCLEVPKKIEGLD